MWRNECIEVKDYYKKLAEEEKANHQLQYPDYKCSPRKSSEIKKRKRSAEDDDYNFSSQGSMLLEDAHEARGSRNAPSGAANSHRVGFNS